MSDKPIGQQNYEQFASRYAKYAKTKPHNAYYERPATGSLLPEVRGMDVLDAGCGPGFRTHELLERGATVVSADVTPQMIELTRELVGSRATLHVADLAKPFEFAESESFDLVIASLMLDYVEEWGPVFREFFRVLRPGGQVVYSHSHPMADYLLLRDKLDSSPHYFSCERFSMAWKGFGKPAPVIEGYRRSLQEMLNPLCEAGFVLEKTLEPLPLDALKDINPDLHSHLSQEPCFLCVRARKPAR